MELKLKFAGILQSYGIPEFYMGQRQTNNEPTLSAICGMIGNALGYIREEEDKLNELKESISIVSIERKLPLSKIIDDQIVGTNGKAYKVANGGDKIANYPMVHKEYIQDNEFIVTIAGNDELMERVRHALERPRRPLHLGRKCCTGYEPILMEG